jgi:hypothetical protein
MKCCDCSSLYHSLCVSISPAELNKLSAEVKANWLCPECQNKKPRSDNSNTPVRPATSANPNTNVTLRRKNHESSLIEPQVGTSVNMSQAELRIIIKEEVSAVIKECVGNLKSEIMGHLKTFREEVSGLKESIQYMNDSFEKMNNDLENCKTKIESITKEKAIMQSDLFAINNRVNQIEQISRASNLEIQCVPERKTENLLTIVTQLSRTVSNPVNDSDILYCSRVAKKNPDSIRPRSILVKLNSPRSRDSLLAAVTKYNKSHPQEKLNTSHIGFGQDKKTSIYVVENLSPEYKLLHALARKRAKELQYKHVWVRGGRIYMRKTDTSEYVLVRNENTLNKLT